MLRIDTWLTWPGSIVLHIRQTGLLLGVCSSLPLIIKRTSSSPVGSWPNQTGLKPGLLGRLNHLHAVWLNSKRSSACVSAALCVFRIWQQNCRLLFCTRLCLWESCYSVSGCCATMSVSLWMQGCVKSSTHRNNHSSSCFLFFLYLLFAAQSRSVSDVRHWWMLSLSDLADTVSREMTRCIISRPPCPELSFLQFSYTLKNNNRSAPCPFPTTQWSIWLSTGYGIFALRAVIMFESFSFSQFCPVSSLSL